MEDKIPSRRIHLDFHTGPTIPHVGRDFDPEWFAERLVKSHVNAMNVFAMCHHGYCYYDTKVGVRHPTLQKDILREMVKALHARNIQVIAYITVKWNERLANEHPDWVEMYKDGTRKTKGFYGWSDLCFTAPFIDDLVIPVGNEVLSDVGVDGIWYDIIWQGHCYCERCLARKKEMGLDPDDEGDNRVYVETLLREVQERIYEANKKVKPDSIITFNNQMGNYYGNRHHTLDYFELELGGFTTDAALKYFVYSRFLEHWNVPVVGQTVRFTEAWGNFGQVRPSLQLVAECGAMYAQGHGVSIGDQMHSNGMGPLDDVPYDAIGTAFGYIERIERIVGPPTTRKVKIPKQVAILLQSPREMMYFPDLSPSFWGVVRLLLDTHYNFGIVVADYEHTWKLLDEVRLLVLPDPLDRAIFNRRAGDGHPGPGGRLAAFVEAVKAFQERGGRVFTCTGVLERTGNELLGDTCDLGVGDYLEYDVMYIQAVAKGLAKKIGLHEYSVKDECNKILIPEKIAGKCKTIGRYIPPYFARMPDEFCGHQHAPPVRPYDEMVPAIVTSPKMFLAGFDLFSQYNRFRFPWLIDLFDHPLRQDAPPEVELDPACDYIDAQYWIQEGAGGGKTAGEKKIVVSLVNYIAPRSPSFTHHVRNAPRLSRLTVRVNLPGDVASNTRVTTATRVSSDGELDGPVRVDQRGNSLVFTLTEVATCEFVIIE